MQRFTPLLIDAAQPCRHVVGSRWFVDETYVKVAGVRRYVYGAVDEYGQVIYVLFSRRRDIAAARRFFVTALDAHGEPGEIVTDRAAALTHVIVTSSDVIFWTHSRYLLNLGGDPVGVQLA